MKQKHEISWGKVIAGAAIGAGAIVVAAFALPAIGMYAASFSGAGIAGWIAGHVLSIATATASAIVANPATSLGLGAAAGMFAADALDKGEENKQEKIEQQIANADMQSFTMREDIRKMQALMVARMQAQGYQPAMAYAPQRK